MYDFGRKKKNSQNRNIKKVLLMLLQHTPFMYKDKIQMLIHIIHAVLMKRCAEAALITFSIFF
jgi:hypothetical protein